MRASRNSRPAVSAPSITPGRRQANACDPIAIEADAQAEVSEQYTGDALQQKFRDLETNRGADMALEDLKRKMGMAPPAEAPAAAAQTNVRVSTAAPVEQVDEEAEAAELERALAEAGQRRQNSGGGGS